MRILSYTLKQARWSVLCATGFSMVSGGATVVTVILIVAELKSHKAPVETTLAFITLAVTAATLRLLASNILTRVSKQHASDLSEQLAKSVVNAGLRQVERLGPSRLLATLTGDIATITSAIAQVPSFMVNCATTLGALVYLAVLSPAIFAVMLVATVLAGIGQTALVRSGTAKLVAARLEDDALLGHIGALTRGISELKLHRARRDEFLSDVLRSTLINMTRLRIEGSSRYNLVVSYQQFIFLLMLGVTVFGGRLFGTDIGTLAGAGVTLLYTRGCLEAVVNSIPGFQAPDIALSKYEEVLSQLSPEQIAVYSSSMFGRFDHLKLVDVHYTYEGDRDRRFSIGPIGLSLHPGEVVFVTGANGSGKTTFAKIIAGLYVPGKGQVCLNNEAIDETSREQYRQFITCVLADFHLFDRLLGLKGPALDAEAAAWLHRLRLSDHVQVNNGVFSTLNLSAGQRRRLALVVAMLEDRPVCIFDEWAADQDPEYREEFYVRLLPELSARRKAIVVISHDDRYYSVGDRLIKMDRGQIVSDVRLR